MTNQFKRLNTKVEIKQKSLIKLQESEMNKQQKIKFILAHPQMSYEELAKKFGMTKEGVRTFCKTNKLPNKRNNIQAKRNDVPLPVKLLLALKDKKFTVIELADMFGVPPKKIYNAIDELKKRNVAVNNLSGEIIELATSLPQQDKPLKIDFIKHKEVETPIGLIADTHIGSKYERLDVLNSLYDRFQSYGIKTVYLAGNMIDGEARFNKYDIYVSGVEGQVKNFIEKFPRQNGIKTYFVTGDDHEGWYIQREHINIGQYIEEIAQRSDRKDLIYLGHMERDIEFKQKRGSAIMRIIHAGGGTAYALSYSSQKYMEALQGGEKPQIVVVGHFHKFDYSYPREVHVIQPGCTQDQTPFMRKKRIQAMVGGCVLWIKQNDLGIFTSVKIEWIPFFDKRFYKYHW